MAGFFKREEIKGEGRNLQERYYNAIIQRLFGLFIIDFDYIERIIFLVDFEHEFFLCSTA